MKEKRGRVPIQAWSQLSQSELTPSAAPPEQITRDLGLNSPTASRTTGLKATRDAMNAPLENPSTCTFSGSSPGPKMLSPVEDFQISEKSFFRKAWSPLCGHFFKSFANSPTSLSQ
eukprot:CAMPEP_0197691404 /NCGR_PEP_ID=MMETSP1338-20131121/109659_1 /TAXON_ID=43686 ORGANISM="Pelagodinium beii, Strain RCC1491" /NCGR_SAMPLE_ID=MMETSP1338 /ASSEMBLY_ACC=CAM_ASM_000754 /LENGTH=115 /DNA_ID=CAMNT_0043273947 /DNA_START=140 /DNA_END=485 /DNA_ORIENTATION=-